MIFSGIANESLETAIIKVVAFFDLFEHPLTAYEIWKNIEQPAELSEILTVLDKLPAALGCRNGFYFLAGREEIVTTRQKRHNYTDRKIKIARRFTKFFQLFPSVRMIAVANSIGQYNLRDESDIDFFIITAPGRLWLSRLYCTGLAKLLNSRPTPQAKRDKICLSFYISDDHLDISDLRLTGADPYFDYWRRHLVLLYNKKGTYEKFLSANGNRPAQADQERDKGQTARRSLMSLENLAKRLQLKIMPPALAAAMNNSDGVVVNDSVLKLYQHDRRREFAEKYGQKINEIAEVNG
ncbi:MAG: hypothetical protein WC456_02865 [Patescibacteria group bacterium]